MSVTILESTVLAVVEIAPREVASEISSSESTGRACDDQRVVARRVRAARCIPVSGLRIVEPVVRVGNAHVIGARRRKRVPQIGVKSDVIFAGSNRIVIGGQLLALRIEQPEVGAQSARTVERRVDIEIYDLARA